MNEGWICPVCRRGVAPTEKHCDHGGGVAAIMPPYQVGPPPPIGPNTTLRPHWTVRAAEAQRVLGDPRVIVGFQHNHSALNS